jgi:hypothetical protein
MMDDMAHEVEIRTLEIFLVQRTNFKAPAESFQCIRRPHYDAESVPPQTDARS